MREHIPSGGAVVDNPFDAVHMELAAVSHLAIAVDRQELAGVETIIFLFDVFDQVHSAILAHLPCFVNALCTAHMVRIRLWCHKTFSRLYTPYHL